MTVDHTFYVDWNSLRDNEVGTLLTLAADPIRAQVNPPAIGEIVGLVDDDGERYEGWVTARDGLWLSIAPYWPSRSYVRVGP